MVMGGALALPAGISTGSTTSSFHRLKRSEMGAIVDIQLAARSSSTSGRSAWNSTSRRGLAGDKATTPLMVRGR
jgi:hypothetical protein